MWKLFDPVESTRKLAISVRIHQPAFKQWQLFLEFFDRKSKHEKNVCNISQISQGDSHATHLIMLLFIFTLTIMMKTQSPEWTLNIHIRPKWTFTEKKRYARWKQASFPPAKWISTRSGLKSEISLQIQTSDPSDHVSWVKYSLEKLPCIFMVKNIRMFCSTCFQLSACVEAWSS